MTGPQLCSGQREDQRVMGGPSHDRLDRMLNHKEIAEILERMNTKYGHDAPLNGIVQYQLLISKTRTQD